MTNKQKQNLLAYLGYYAGEIDGLWGDQSRQATKGLQHDHGLTEDGDYGDQTHQTAKYAVANDLFKTGEEPQQAEDTTAEDSSAAGTFWAEIKHFTRREFRCPCGKCGGFPVEPQEALVRVADEMREEFGVPVIIVPEDGHSGGSGVRCQAYNDSLSGSVSNSRHVLGKAFDFSAPGKSAAQIEAYLAKIKAAGTIRYWYKITAGSYHVDIL